MLYKSARYNFLTLLTDYYRHYIFPNKPLEEYSMTLMETAIECIKYYDKTKGVFLHLFNGSMKRDLHIAKAKELIDNKRRGIKVAGEDDKLIRRIMALASSKGLDVYDMAIQEKIAKILDIGADKIRELIQLNDNTVAVSGTLKNDDGEEIEIYDFQPSHDPTVEDSLCEKSAIIELVDKIESVFVTVQQRQKRLLSMLLTVEIIKALDYDVAKTTEILQGKELLNDEVVRLYVKNKELPTAKQIGLWCRVSEQSLSRTYKNFREKLK